jgi:hypothetical protein
VEDGEERAHRGKDIDGEVGGSGGRRRAVLVVFKTSRSDDGVQGEATMVMARRRRQVLPGTWMRCDWS